MIRILNNFESANAEIIDCKDASNIRLNIRKDSQSTHFQWFYFGVAADKARKLCIHLCNAFEASYPEGWEGYNACASYDNQNWFRVPTRYDGKELIIEHEAEYPLVYYAYFPPYSYERHQQMTGNAMLSPIVSYECAGLTHEKRSIDKLCIGNAGEGKKNIWIIARQHPGETMASWFMEGLLNRLLDIDDPVSRTLLSKAVFHIAPHMNPDGAIAGNLRCTTQGVNLNREWQDPDPEKAPEVYNIKRLMKSTGVDLMLDIHGDEGLPYTFISSIEGIPGFTPKLGKLLSDFKDYWEKISPDFQDEFTYPKDEPGKGNLKICSKQIGHTFGCLSLTIEMPFKDNKNLPDEFTGWSPERSMILGESVLNAILCIIDEL